MNIIGNIRKAVPLCALALLLMGVTARAEEGVLTLPSGLLSIEEEAFYGVDSADKAVIPDGTVSIGPRAFAQSGFSEIRLPSSVTQIAEGAFYSCGDPSRPLRYYCIPYGVEIGPQAFALCRAEIYIDGRPLPYFNYTVQEDGVTITGLSGNAAISAAVIPDTIDGKPVTAIANGVFNGMRSLTRVYIPSTVTSIGNEAFRGCSALTGIELPASLTTLGNGVFRSCTALAALELPSGLTSIGNNAFRECSALTQIEIPSGVTQIAYDTFSGAQNLQRVVLPEGLTAIGATAFYDCYTLSELNIPSTVTDIGYKAFGYNRALTRAVIPAGITALPNELFFGCSSLESVSLPEALVSIGDYSFAGCTKLTDVNFPSGLSSIGRSGFENACRNQAGYPVYRLPDTLETLGQSTFDGCGAALCVTRGGSLESLLKENGNTLTYYDRLDFRYQYKKVDNVFTLHLTGYAGEGGNVTIPAGPVIIGENAFKGNTAISGVVIPEGVTKIDRWAFENCSALGSVTMTDSVLTIEDAAFRGCAALSEVAFSDSLTKIGSDAFDNTCTAEGTHYYNLPDDVAEFGWTPFSDCGAVLCVSRGSSAETLARSNAYGGNYTHPGETDFRFRYDSDKGLERLTQYTGTGKTSASVPAYVWLIDDNAFRDHTELTSVVLPDTVTQINGSAFRDCTNLTDLSLPGSLTEIRDYAFAGCGSGAAGSFTLELPSDISTVGSTGVFDRTAILICDKESATASVISNRGYAFVRSDRPEETDFRYKYNYFDQVWSWGLYDYTGSESSVRLPDDCLNASSDLLGQKVADGLELVCAQLSGTADALSAAGVSFTFPGHENFRYQLIDDILYIMEYTGSSNEIIIPQAEAYVQDGNHEIRIRRNAFRGMENITKVVIPEGVKEIEDSAFRGTVNLTDVTFPSTLEKLENHAFEQCGKNADYLHYYVLPDGMTFVSTNVDAGWGAFTDIGMGRVAAAPGSSTALQLSGIDTFNHGGSYRFALKGHETDGLLYHYRTYTTDAGSENRLVLEQYEGSGGEVTIPENCGIYAIGNNVFAGKPNLEKIIIPDGVEQIGSSAFDGCTMLHDGAEEFAIILPSSVKSIGNLAFKDLGAGYTAQRFFLVLPYGLETFDLNIFTNCNAVLVAPAGSHAAGVLYAGWYRYYNTLEDARASRNMQIRIPEQGQTVTYLGRT